MKRLSSRRPWRLWLGGNGHRVLGGVGLGATTQLDCFLELSGWWMVRRDKQKGGRMEEHQVPFNIFADSPSPSQSPCDGDCDDASPCANPCSPPPFPKPQPAPS
jgi:hypothetical protein